MAATQYLSGVDKSNRSKNVQVREIEMTRGPIKVYSGTAATRAAVRALVGDGAPQGSMFIGISAVATTKPNFYIKTANGAADTDWERVLTQASD